MHIFDGSFLQVLDEGCQTRSTLRQTLVDHRCPCLEIIFIQILVVRYKHAVIILVGNAASKLDGLFGYFTQARLQVGSVLAETADPRLGLAGPSILDSFCEVRGITIPLIVVIFLDLLDDTFIPDLMQIEMPVIVKALFHFDAVATQIGAPRNVQWLVDVTHEVRDEAQGFILDSEVVLR